MNLNAFPTSVGCRPRAEPLPRLRHVAFFDTSGRRNVSVRAPHADRRQPLVESEVFGRSPFTRRSLNSTLDPRLKPTKIMFADQVFVGILRRVEVEGSWTLGWLQI